MTDIVERLRDLSAHLDQQTNLEAADEIERLRAPAQRAPTESAPVLIASQNNAESDPSVMSGRAGADTCRKALEPFADIARGEVFADFAGKEAVFMLYKPNGSRFALINASAFSDALATLTSTPSEPAQCALPPEGATHMRRPEYLTAWLFDGVATMPLWLIERYHSQPLPEHRKGLYALAVDGEFWRWMDVAKFDELYVSAVTSTDGGGK